MAVIELEDEIRPDASEVLTYFAARRVHCRVLDRPRGCRRAGDTIRHAGSVRAVASSDDVRDRSDEIEQLRRDLDGAVAAAREAEAEAGRLRGTIAEMQTQLARARQDQESFQLILDTKRRVSARVAGVTQRVRGRLRTSPR
jgi:chromosome segregation ATPase